MAKTSTKTARPFATNNLVRDHEIYAKFMERRANELKNDGLTVDPPIRLFYKRGIPYKDLLGSGTATDVNTIYRAICKWHCSVIAYDIWCDLVEKHGSIYDSAIPYKQTVSLHVVYINSFKEKFEKTVQDAGCDYNKRNSHSHVKKDSWDACRYLVMYWTYLDIIKDEKAQRYFPDKQTRFEAAPVFGYMDGQNPFEMNAKYWHHDNDTEEDQPMEEEKKYNLNLDTPIEELDFSTRSLNCLWRAGHRTLGDVLKLKYEDLMKIRNLGLRHTKEILEKLEEIKKQSEESVIDIAEEAAKKVEEEEKLVVHDNSYVIHDEDAKVLAGLGKRLEKIDLEMDDIRANAAAKNACVMLDKRIDTLKDNTCKKFSEIDGDIVKLDNRLTRSFKELYDLLQAHHRESIRSSEPTVPPIIARRPSDDILSLCNQIVAIMQKSGMEEFCMKGEWVIDIRKKAEMGRATITYR